MRRRVANGANAARREEGGKRPVSWLRFAAPPKINMAVTIKQVMRQKKRKFKCAATPQRE